MVPVDVLESRLGCVRLSSRCSSFRVGLRPHTSAAAAAAEAAAAAAAAAAATATATATATAVAAVATAVWG